MRKKGKPGRPSLAEIPPSLKPRDSDALAKNCRECCNATVAACNQDCGIPDTTIPPPRDQAEGRQE